MRMNKLGIMALGAALLGGIPPMDMPKAVNSRGVITRRATKNTKRKSPGKHGKGKNHFLPKEQQQEIIAASNIKHARNAVNRIAAASYRDAGYYRVKNGSNLHRFRPYAHLEA
jgi:hypothetical protein